MQQLLITGPLTIADILDRTFRIYRRYFNDLALIAAVWYIPLGLLQLLMVNASADAPSLFGEILNIPESVIRGQQTDEAVLLGVGALFFVFGIVAIVGFLAVTLAITYQSVQIVHGSPVSLGASLQGGLSRVWSYIGMSLLLILMAIPAVILAIIPVCGIIAVVIGIIYLAGRWLVLLPVLVAERTGPIGTLQASWNLTEGFVLRSIGFGLLVGLLGWALNLGSGSVLNTLFQYTLPATIAGSLSIVVATALSTLWTPVSLLAPVLYYFDLKVRREGYDLNMRINQFESEVSQSSPDSGATW